MKRTQTTYHCDVCHAEIEREQTVVDLMDRNFGLCDRCREEGFVLRTYPLTESYQRVVHLLSPDDT